jgi:hypothetical protein
MNDIRPLKGPLEISAGFPIWLFIVLILAALIIALSVYFKKKKGIKTKPDMHPRLPEEIARDGLKALLEMRLAEKGLIKEYYIRLSDIIRGYIEDRYRIFAMDRTTWELYYEMKSNKIERSHIDKINDFLEDCDMVKFAKYRPTEKEIGDIYEKAEEIIDITTDKESYKL